MTDQYPVPGQPEGTWQASDGAPVASPDAAPAAADHAPAVAPDPAAQPVAGHAPDAWPTPSGWQAPQDNPYGAPAGPSAYAAGYPTGQAAGYPAAPSAGPAWQSQTSAYPGYGYPGTPDQAAGAGNWQYDTTAFAAAGAPPVAPPTAPSRSGSGGPKSRTGLILVTAALVGLLSGGLGAYAVTQADSSSSGTSTVALPQSGADKSERPSGTVAAIAASVSPAVVSLEVNGAQGSGTGSGFVIRDNGYIVTNNHVVEGAADGGDITVHFADGRKFDAKIVGRDANYDIAVVKVDAVGPADGGPRQFGRRRGRRPGHRHRLAPGPRRHRHRRHRQRAQPPGHRRRPGRDRRSSTRSRPTRRSTPATPVGRWSTPPARSSASTPRSPRWATGRGRAARSAWASRSRSTRSSASPRS